jgi:hypothetical protein
MDVDASERRPDGGRRGSHEAPMTDKPSELYQIQEPEAPVKREVLHLTGIQSHGPASLRAVGPPWPPQVAWREHLHRAKKIGV